MPNDTQAIDTNAAAPAAPIVDTPAAPSAPAAPASAAPAEGTPAVDTSTNTATPPADGENGTQQEQNRDDKGQFKSGVQKRIDTLIFQRNQAERDAAYWRQQAETAKAPSPAPKLADFETHDEYDHAMQQHRIDEGVNRGLAKTAEQQAARLTEQAQTATAEAYNQRAAEAATRLPDWAEVVGKSTAPMSPALQEALMESDRGPDLVYHLAKNPAEAERLNGMSVRQMDREIGRLESELAGKGPTAAPAAPAARTTTAPPPATPAPVAALAPSHEDPSKMTQAQYEAWRRGNGSRFIR